jgi:nuclear pore complex protein Nup85
MLINMERDVDSSSSSYWATVKTLILQGQVDTARAILRLHSSSETMTFQLADKDLSSMPIFNSMYGGGSLQKFRSQFSYWSSSLQTRIESGLYSTEPELEGIMKLIIGNIDSWREVTKESTCWYEYFAGYLLFNQNSVRYFELGPFVDSWLAEWVSVKSGTNTASLKHLDRSILAIMKNDITEFVSLIQNVADNKWFVVHLVDLLMHSNKLCLADDDNNSKSSKIMRENLVADYGIILMSRENMWKIGFEYLEFCTSEEIGIRDSLLTRIPIKNDVSAMKMISFVRRFGLFAVEQEICKIMYRRAMTLQRYGNAMEWAIRSRDNVHVTKIANIFLDHYCKTGEMMHRNLLSQLGSKLLMFVAPRLLFLIKYFDFHTLYRSRQFPQAAELIVGLMDSKIVPPFFWPTLMADTLPLLEHQDPIIPSKETYIIIRHIENNLVPLSDNKLKNTSEEKEENLNLIRGFPNELIQVLRLACTRNLSRALMIENTL